MAREIVEPRRRRSKGGGATVRSLEMLGVNAIYPTLLGVARKDSRPMRCSKQATRNVDFSPSLGVTTGIKPLVIFAPVLYVIYSRCQPLHLL